MSHSLSHWDSGCCQHSGSCQHQRSQSLGQWKEDHQVMSHHRDTHSSSWQKRCVTFAEGRPPHPLTTAWKEMLGWTEPTSCFSWPGELRAQCSTVLIGWRLREEKGSRSVPHHWNPTSRSSWVGMRHCWLEQDWRTASQELSCPTTPNRPYGKCRVDIVACSTGGHTRLVAGVKRGPWP